MTGLSMHWPQEVIPHEAAAISEGMCPDHRIPLEPVITKPRRIAGYCTPCGKFWGINADNDRVGWWLDIDAAEPGRFSWPVAPFMIWGIP